MFDRLLLLAVVVVAPGLPGHALLVNVPALRVYGPAGHAGVPCIHALPLPANALASVKRAVALAMPPFEAGLKLDGRDPRIKVRPALSSGYNYRAGGCGRTTWAKSIVAFVSLPHIRSSASLSQHTFAVARVRDGWVLWAWIH
jgi:hypothetical protein